MARRPIETWSFALVVVRHRDRFLVIQEREHGQLWWLPAGRVEPGETLQEAAVRETLEESGVRVALTGILALQYTPMADGARLRAIFTAEPEGDPTPLAPPGNEHALQARWISVEELRHLALRSEDVWHWFDLAQRGAIHPLSVLQAED